jgi:hypothetical protein
MNGHRNSTRAEAFEAFHRAHSAPTAVQTRLLLAVAGVLTLASCDLFTGPAGDRVRLHVAGPVTYEATGTAAGQLVVLYDYPSGGSSDYRLMAVDRTDDAGYYFPEGDSRAGYVNCDGTNVAVSEVTDFLSLQIGNAPRTGVACVSSTQRIDIVIPDSVSA